MITQKHGRKLASQLGEVLFVCQFYDLQIEPKVSLSLRNFVVALSVCLSFLSTKALHNFKIYESKWIFKFEIKNIMQQNRHAVWIN